MTEPGDLQPEQLARREIDRQLEAAGWVVQYKDRVNLAAGRGVAIREVQLKPGHGFVVASAVRLARLNAIYRAGRGFEYLEVPITEGQLVELRELSRHIEADVWRTEGPCSLNSVFGMASLAIGGADADAIVGSLLVDVKITKKLTVTQDDWLQIIGYRLLSMVDRGVSGDVPISIDSLGIYFARYGYLARVGS